ncbi:MAG: hypothetical protein AB7F36_14410 [Reyranellaceae bacterium]
MARHFSVPHFFRQVPNPLLKRYFDYIGLFPEFDFEALPETKPGPLLAEWDGLPEKRRQEIERQLREIFDLACDKGAVAILDEARWQHANDPAKLQALTAKLADIKSHYARAMTTFLDHKECWRGATMHYHADSLVHWRKRRGLPRQPAALDHESRAVLADGIGTWFREAEGRGRNCHVDVLKRGERDYFFVYPEDWADARIEWINNQFGRPERTPAFEVVFMWNARDGALELNHRGDKKAKDALQAMFARTILKLDRLPPKDEDSYDLEPLKRRGFQFRYPAGSGIEAVRVRKLRLESASRKSDRLVLEANVRQDENALYDLLEQAGRAFPLQVWQATQAEIVVRLAATDDRAARWESFTISAPSSCTLKFDELGLTLHDMLVESWIERR